MGTLSSFIDFQHNYTINNAHVIIAVLFSFTLLCISIFLLREKLGINRGCKTSNCCACGRSLWLSFLFLRESESLCFLCFVLSRQTRLDFLFSTRVWFWALRCRSHFVHGDKWLRESCSAAEMMDRAFVVFRHRNCIGWLQKEDNSQFSHRYKWLSYAEVRRRAHWLGHSIVDICGVSSGQMVGLMTCVSRPWFITEFACLLKGLGIVPIHKGSSKDCVAHIIRESGMTVLFVSVHLNKLVSDSLEHLIRGEEKSPLQHIVWIEDEPEAYSLVFPLPPSTNDEAPSLKGIHEHKWNDLLSKCTSQPNLWHTHFSEAPESIVKLLPTSGSTGLPKLTIVTDAMLRPKRDPLPDSAPATECGVQLAYDLVRQPTDVLFTGGCIGVYSGSLDRLTKDCQALGPTSFCAAPTLWNGLHREFEAEAAAREAGRGAGESAGDARKGLLLEWRARRLLGDRVRVLVSTGAPIEHRVCRWAVRVFGCLLLNAYGSTETGAIAADGTTAAGVEVRLLPCPALGYTAAERPHPRGEIAVRSPRISPGYYSARGGRGAAGGGESIGAAGDEEGGEGNERWATLEDGGRFLRTGDVGELLPGGGVRVVDRLRAHFKLAHGRFVAPAPLEAALLAGPYAAQVFVHGTGAMSKVLAVVVPAPALVDRVAADLLPPAPHAASAPGAGGERDAARRRLLCGTARYAAAARRLLSGWFEEAVAGGGLAAWEVPGRVELEAEAFSESNGLLTANGKLCRPALVRKYRHLCAAAPTPPDTYASPDVPVAAATVGGAEERLSAACPGLFALLEEMGLGGAAAEAEAGWGPRRLGLDSMGLARLSARIERRYGAVLPPGRLAAAPSLRAVEDALLSGAPQAAPFGAVGQVRWEREVQRGWRVLEEELAAAAAAAGCEGGGAPSAAAGEGVGAYEAAAAVLITGCTGFVGAFLLAELVRRRRAPCAPRLVCLVRATDGAAAEARLWSTLKRYVLLEPGGAMDAALQSAAVTAVAGDVALPRLGMSEADWQRLAATLAGVYHCAAAVDGTAPYASLAAQNVHGTARVLALALHSGSGDAGAGGRRRVEVNHVSTLGCTRQGGEETLDPTAGGPDGMGGYAQSKWVAEQVVFLAQRELGATARVFRPGVVAGHSKSGASNARDLVSLLVCGLAREGILPDDDPAVPPHWNLCPVDFVAAAIAHIATQPHSLGGVFHLCAPAPLPLNTIASWLAGLGYPLRHVSAAAFRAAVRAAPEDHPLFLVGSLIPATPECMSPAAPTVRSRPSRKRASAALAEMQDAPPDTVTREAFGAAVAFFEREGLLGAWRAR